MNCRWKSRVSKLECSTQQGEFLHIIQQKANFNFFEIDDGTKVASDVSVPIFHIHLSNILLIEEFTSLIIGVGIYKKIFIQISLRKIQSNFGSK